MSNTVWNLSLLILLFHRSLAITTVGCNETVSCWSHPPGCQNKDPDACISSVRWVMQEKGLNFQLESYVSDLDPSRPFYIALGFSYNLRMDDDTVVECVVGTDGKKAVARVSFNDETKNAVLFQASTVLLSIPTVSLVDGLMTCNSTLLIDNVDQVNVADQFKIHDIESQPFHLLFARGNADPFSYEKDIHSVNDNPQFPWMSTEQVSFCRNNCSSPQHIIVEGGMQSRVPRYWRYRIAVIHGSVLLLCWWVLISNAILLARYFKPVWPRRKLLGAAVWFQLHRTLAIIAVPLQVTCVLLIFYQAGWVWYQCSYECTPEVFAKKMHAICGVVATALAVLQPFIALVRPAPDSSRRPIFNWSHWFIGMTAWCFASATIVMSIPLGKTGISRVYGAAPNYIMGGYIIFFVVVNVLLEALSSTTVRRTEKIDETHVHRFVVGSSGMALNVLNGPVTEAPTAPPIRSSARLLLLFLHAVVSLGVTITIIVFLVEILWSHSP